MKKYKISEIADVQSGLVLSRKAAKETDGKYPYQRLTLRSVTEDCLFDNTSFETYDACEIVDKQFITHKNDIIVRLYYPICATLITEENEGADCTFSIGNYSFKRRLPIFAGICECLFDE